MNGWLWMVSIRSLLTASMCAHAPMYCSRPSAGVTLKKSIVFLPAMRLRRFRRQLHFQVRAVLRRQVRRRMRDRLLQRLHVARRREYFRRQLRRASGGIEIGQQLIGPRLRQFRFQPEPAVGPILRMHVREIFQILADQEQMEQFLVHDLEFLDRLLVLRVEHAKIEGHVAAGRDLPRLGFELHRILDRLRDPRHQRHAAARALPRALGAHLGIHGTDERRRRRLHVRRGILRECLQTGQQDQTSKGQTEVVEYPPSTAMTWPVM